MAPVSWDNVLILQTSFIGDTVLTLPLIAEVRRRFPVKKLTFLCIPLSRELLLDHPGIDEVITDDKKNSDRGWRGLRRTAARLKEKKFTLALTPHKSLRSALILYLAGIPHRVGFRESRGWFLFQQRPKRSAVLHDVERNLSVLQAFGVSPGQCQRKLDLPVSAVIQQSVDEKLRALGVTEKEVVFGISPGSVWPTKRWSTAGFAALVRMLQQRYGCRILLFGGSADAGVVAEVQRGCGESAISLVGKLGLRELPAAINRCRVFITNDSGPMHVAVARQVPTVAIFCATTPQLGFYPYTENAIVVQRDLSCRPCTSHGGRRCPLGTEDCIRQISPDAVARAVEKILEGRRRLSPLAFQPRVMTV
ncbi:MAG TPA: lipopolysaccharide heptosyltransferase II [Candidatus Binatia bacterium]|jgi:heptosyltransferase-2